MPLTQIMKIRSGSCCFPAEDGGEGMPGVEFLMGDVYRDVVHDAVFAGGFRVRGSRGGWRGWRMLGPRAASGRSEGLGGVFRACGSEVGVGEVCRVDG